jgi:hypothetical protein
MREQGQETGEQLGEYVHLALSSRGSNGPLDVGTLSTWLWLSEGHTLIGLTREEFKRIPWFMVVID